MADTRWLGRAGAVAEVDTITIANTWAQGDTITVTINGKDLVVTVGTLTTTSQVATTLQEAWEGDTLTDTSASVVPANGKADFIEHSELTATVSSAVVTLTADTAGIPYGYIGGSGITGGLTASATTAGDGDVTLANGTEATGPNHRDNADNWSAGEVPGTSPATNVWVDNSDVSLLYGEFATANDLTSFNVAESFIGDIGLANTNANGYYEFRPTYMQVDATTVKIGYGEGTGSGRIKLDSGSIQTAVTIESSGSPAENGLGSVVWKGSNASNTMNVQDGSVSIAPFDGETATLATVDVNAGTFSAVDGLTGPTTLSVHGGDVFVRTNITTVTITAGTITVEQTATVTTLNGQGGTVVYKSNGTIGTLNAGGPRGFVLDCDKDNRDRTITTCNLSAGSTIRDKLQTVTYTNGIAVGSDVEQVVAS